MGESGRARCEEAKLCGNERIKVIIFLVDSSARLMLALPFLRPIITALDLPACRSLAATLLSFLNQEQILAISQAAAYSKQSHFFLHLVRNSLFLSQYLNRTDKSLYFPFYGEDQYKSIEIAQIAAITQESSTVFLDYHQDYNAVFKKMEPSLPGDGEEREILRNLLADPDLPLPRLKRETQGMYCSSPFQLFLVDCTFRQDQEEDASCFQQFREFLSLQREQQYLKQFIAILKDKSAASNELRKIMKVRYTPYEVTAKNMGEFLIQGNELHNFIVGLFALTDIMVESTHTFISLIPDPLHRLVQLLLRYSIFRNYVLAVQDYLSFAFRTYENIYHDSIELDPKKPQYKFWRPALTKWFLRMNHLHSQGTEVYMHCLTKLRNKKSCEILLELCGENQLKYGKILNRVELNPFHCQLAQGIFDGQCSASSEIAHYFDQHPDNYEVLVMEFNEYLIDISVNEQTVHWCGHSNHQLEEPYLAYEQKLVELNAEYMRSLLEDVGSEERSEVIKLDIEYLSLLQIKNRTLKKIVQQLNEDMCQQHQLTFDFDQADHKLEYFNQKALILAQVDQNERPFYSIPPLCSPDKLIDMLDTNDSSSNNSEEENYEYHSDSQGQRVQTPFINEETEQPQLLPAKKPAPLKKFFAQDFQPSSAAKGSSLGDEAL